MYTQNIPLSPPAAFMPILVAEDALFASAPITHSLENIGYSVSHANSGSEALSEMTHHQFKVVFMDVQLPEMGGAKATMAMRVREKEEGGHVTIIAMSRQPGRRDRKHCLACGMDRYISKPVSSDSLRHILEAISNPESVLAMESPVVWNRALTLERIGGDERTLIELVRLFILQQASLLAEINRSLRARQPESFESASLALSEELSFMGAAELSESGRKMAWLGKNESFAEASAYAVGFQMRLYKMNIEMSRPPL